MHQHDGLLHSFAQSFQKTTERERVFYVVVLVVAVAVVVVDASPRTQNIICKD